VGIDVHSTGHADDDSGAGFLLRGSGPPEECFAILMQCFIIMCVISLQWVLFGYSLAFGPDTGQGIIGSLDWGRPQACRRTAL